LPVLFMLYLLLCRYRGHTAWITDEWVWTLGNGRMIDGTRNQKYSKKTMCQWNSVYH